MVLVQGLELGRGGDDPAAGFDDDDDAAEAFIFEKFLRKELLRQGGEDCKPEHWIYSKGQTTAAINGGNFDITTIRVLLATYIRIIGCNSVNIPVREDINEAVSHFTTLTSDG